MKFVVYALFDETGKPFYVGSTNDGVRRRRDHLRRQKRKHTFKILEKGEEGRFEAEERWILEFQKQGHILINKKITHSGLTHHTDEAKEKIKKSGSRKTQFNGERPINEKKRRQSLRAHWAALSSAKKSEILTNTNLKAWANRTDEQRSAIGKKIAATRTKNHTTEELSLIASRNASKMFEKLGAREKTGSWIKNWWANMTPEYRKEYLARRAEKIREGKARGK